MLGMGGGVGAGLAPGLRDGAGPAERMCAFVGIGRPGF